MMMMNAIVPHPPPVFPDQFPILGSGMNNNNGLPTSPNNSFREGDNRFCPSDQRLISHYLLQKMLGNEDQVYPIFEIDILNYEPWDLLPIGREHQHEEAYYFCRRQSYFSSKDRYKRTTGNGYWKPTGKHREIKSGSSGEVIGRKRSLVFHFRKSAGQGTGYIMHEYSATLSIGMQTVREDLVLCKIMKKVSKHNSTTKTTATKLSKKDKVALVTPTIPSDENINTITLPCQEEEADSYKVTSDIGNQNTIFQEAFSNDQGGTMEMTPFPDIPFGDGDNHSPLPDLDFNFDLLDFDFDADSAVRDILPPP